MWFIWNTPHLRKKKPETESDCFLNILMHYCTPNIKQNNKRIVIMLSISVHNNSIRPITQRQVHLKKKIEYHEKGQYFLSLISESGAHILYKFISHSVKYFKPLFLECFYYYGLQIMKTQNSVSQKIWILHNIRKLCSFLCTQYLVGPPFAWITASSGMEAISQFCCVMAFL